MTLASTGILGFLGTLAGGGGGDGAGGKEDFELEEGWQQLSSCALLVGRGGSHLRGLSCRQMRIWDGAHHWEGSWLPSLYEFLVLNFS